MPKIKEKSPEEFNRVQNLHALLELLEPFDPEWLEEPLEDGRDQLEPVPCDSWDSVVGSWEAAMSGWHEGLQTALGAMLASCASVMLQGDQLWFKILGPPSCGKSTLCEAISVSTRYVLAKSTIRGFVSGFGMGDEDHSLITKLLGMTLVTKDGDTLMQSPNVSQILSEGRDAYDGVTRTNYRTGRGGDYQSRFTWILCGTNSLASLDQSELGARFLDVVVLEDIDDEFEDNILLDVARRANSANEEEVTDEATTKHTPEMIKAMQLTAGYLEHLRGNQKELAKSVKFNDAELKKVTRYAKFIAFFRARPSLHNKENAEREFAARLTVQCTRTAKMLGMVYQKKKVDSEVIKQVRRIALNTCRGVTFNIGHYLFVNDETGLEVKAIAGRVELTTQECREMIRFLVKIKVVERVVDEDGKTLPTYRLTPTAYNLWTEVVL